MIDIGKIKDAHDAYTKAIREILSEIEGLMFLRRKARTEGERLRYDAAILNNGLAINRACQERLKLTLQVIG